MPWDSWAGMIELPRGCAYHRKSIGNIHKTLFSIPRAVVGRVEPRPTDLTLGRTDSSLFNQDVSRTKAPVGE